MGIPWEDCEEAPAEARVHSSDVLVQCIDCIHSMRGSTSHGVVGGGSAHAIVTSYNYTDTLQVYRHPTSIQKSYKYTEILQVYSIQNTSPDAQIQVQTSKIQVQTPKYKFRHPKYESRHPKYKSRHPKYIFGDVYGHIYIYIYI